MKFIILRAVVILVTTALCTATAWSADVDHDNKVKAAVASYLKKGFDRPGKIAVETRIQFALKNATETRDKDTSDTILRDAEYYLHGLYATSAKDVEHAIPVAGAPVYEALKWAALKLKEQGVALPEKLMRADASKPVSAPGGWTWAYKGLMQGKDINGKTEVGPGPPPGNLAPR